MTLPERGIFYLYWLVQVFGSLLMLLTGGFRCALFYIAAVVAAYIVGHILGIKKATDIFLAEAEHEEGVSGNERAESDV